MCWVFFWGRLKDQGTTKKNARHFVQGVFLLKDKIYYGAAAKTKSAAIRFPAGPGTLIAFMASVTGALPT